ncbi:2-C-methyl-D-erythritol 4-phosphate cytidylyltransferase [bacterium]|nr:2-C-methyl-D-erythritol 4-phosphate cytidylyltransferase [bacterium]
MNYGIILASGLGTRFNTDLPKQFTKIAGKTVIEHTIDVFESSKHIDRIIVVITPEYRHIFENILLKNHFTKIYKVLNGGDTRKESSFIGISSIDDKDANVLIHDCARPFLSESIIDDCVTALKTHDAVDVAIPASDTLIEVDKNNNITSIPNRANMRRGQTPQCFKLSVIKKAHELSRNDENFTDDCGLIVQHNLCPVHVVQGDTQNIKITFPEDIFLADKLFQIKSIASVHSEKYADLKGKVMAVFGGNSGIGKCLIDMAAKYGAKTFAFSSSNGVDISDYNTICQKLADVYKQTGRIDYVINTAGVLKIGKLTDRNIEDINKEIMINYMGNVYICKAAIPYLTKTQGKILLFASSSYTRGRALYSTYSSTKAAVVNLSQALAEELAPDNIKLNVINPERTATPMRFKAFGKEPADSLLQPEKVAEASIDTLLSELTGQVIDVRRR